MQTTKEIIEIVKFYKNGGLVHSSNVGKMTEAVFNFQHYEYTPFDHNFKVGDWVEIICHDIFPSLEGNKFQIDAISSGGSIFAKDLRCLFKSEDINYCIIKPAKAPEPEYVKFTGDTFPKGLVFIKHESWTRGHCLVTEFSDKVSFGGSRVISYEELFEGDWLISLDCCKTWGIAGVKE